MKKYIIIAILFIAFFGNNTSYLYAEEVTTEEVSTEEVKQLKLEGVEVLGKNKVELEFDSIIANGDDKDISVKNIGDDGDEVSVSDYEVNEKKVLLILEEDLESNKDYEVVIFSVMGEDGSTITSGLDGALKFTTPDLSIFDKKVDMNSAGSEEKKEEIKKEEKKEEIEKEVKEEKNNNLAGKEIEEKEVDKNIEVTASKTDKLVKTGPEDTLLIILALIFGALVFYAINQRKNNRI